MPGSVPVRDLMINRNEWPQLRAGTPIRNAVRILRILSEERKILHGHSTPLVLDDDYNLLGIMRLTDLLRNIRHLCDDPDKACNLDEATGPVSELVIPYGPGYRVYFARTGNTVVLLLCGGDKSTQPRDISTAKEYWLDYQRRS